MFSEGERVAQLVNVGATRVLRERRARELPEWRVRYLGLAQREAGQGDSGRGCNAEATVCVAFLTLYPHVCVHLCRYWYLHL